MDEAIARARLRTATRALRAADFGDYVVRPDDDDGGGGGDDEWYPIEDGPIDEYRRAIRLESRDSPADRTRRASLTFAARFARGTAQLVGTGIGRVAIGRDPELSPGARLGREMVVSLCAQPLSDHDVGLFDILGEYRGYLYARARGSGGIYRRQSDASQDFTLYATRARWARYDQPETYLRPPRFAERETPFATIWASRMPDRRRARRPLAG
jgi:hypothetical protein